MRVPLKRTGAELHMRAFPQLNLGWRLISGAIFLLSLTAVIAFSSSSVFQVQALTLEGAQRLTSDAILSQTGLAGTSIFKIAPADLEARILSQFPEVQDVDISVGLPSNLTMVLAERQPLVAWQQASGTLWIDADGVMFPARGEAELALTITAASDPPGEVQSVPSGESSQADDENPLPLLQPALPRTTPEFVQGVLNLVGFVPEGAYLQYDPDFGLGWRDPRGWLVYFGKSAADIDLKLAEYETIIIKLQQENLTPALISLEFLHAPFYRLEQ